MSIQKPNSSAKWAHCAVAEEPAPPGSAGLVAGLQGWGSTSARPQLWAAWPWGVSPTSASKALAGSRVNEHFLCARHCWVLYIHPSINFLGDVAGSIIISMWETRKQARHWPVLAKDTCQSRAELVFKPRSVLFQNSVVSNISHDFPNKIRNLSILSEMKNTCWEMPISKYSLNQIIAM